MMYIHNNNEEIRRREFKIVNLFHLYGKSYRCTCSISQASVNACSHTFCYTCINRWTAVCYFMTQRKPNCPICRRPVRKIRHGNLTKVVRRRRSSIQNLSVPPRPAQIYQTSQFVETIPVMPMTFLVPNPYMYTYYMMPNVYAPGMSPVMMPIYHV